MQSNKRIKIWKNQEVQVIDMNNERFRNIIREKISNNQNEIKQEVTTMLWV